MLFPKLATVPAAPVSARNTRPAIVCLNINSRKRPESWADTILKPRCWWGSASCPGRRRRSRNGGCTVGGRTGGGGEGQRADPGDTTGDLDTGNHRRGDLPYLEPLNSTARGELLLVLLGDFGGLTANLTGTSEGTVDLAHLVAACGMRGTERPGEVKTGFGWGRRKKEQLGKTKNQKRIGEE